MAIAATEKLTTPEPRKVSVALRATAAISAPVSTPRRVTCSWTWWVSRSINQTTTSRPPMIAGACLVVGSHLGRAARAGSALTGVELNQKGLISLLL